MRIHRPPQIKSWIVAKKQAKNDNEIEDKIAARIASDLCLDFAVQVERLLELTYMLATKYEGKTKDDALALIAGESDLSDFNFHKLKMLLINKGMA